MMMILFGRAELAWRCVIAAGSMAPIAAGAVDVTGAGATFPAPLYQAWIQSFGAEHPDAKFSYEPVGSGEGVRRFTAGEVDFGASDSAMTDEEMARVSGGVALVPATAGMVVLAYNLPGFTGELRLGQKTLVGIFSGQIRTWNDPQIAADNPGATLPSQTITLVTRRDRSGTTFAFTNHLGAIDPTWRDSGPGVGTLVDWPGLSMSVVGNEGVAGRIAIAEYSIGYVEYGFATRLKLPLAALQNRAGTFVRPDPAAGAEALRASVGDMPESGRLFVSDPAGDKAYPIVTYSWLLLDRSYRDPAVGSALRAFVDYGLGQGQQVAEELGYIPLPDEVVARSKVLLDSVK